MTLDPFLMVSPQIIRGPQPSFEDLQRLQSQGLKMVVNLREEAEDSSFYCRQLKLEYHHIPIPDWTAPHLHQVEEFLALVEQPTRVPLLVHCLGGIGRTGVMVSAFRIARGMAVKEAVDQSHAEVPWMSMNREQIQFLQDWERRVRGG